MSDPKVLASARLAKRLGPCFTVTVQGHRLPLRPLSQTDGFGRLGLFLLFSEHEGAAALRHWLTENYCEGDDADPLTLARRPGEFYWGNVTEPMQNPADRAGAAVTECAFSPKLGLETRALLDAGIIRDCRRMTTDMAPVYEVLNMESWEALQLTEDGEMLNRLPAAAPAPVAAAAAAAGEPATSRCCSCGAVAARLLRCTGSCGGAASYCDRACQTRDWPSHRSGGCRKL